MARTKEAAVRRRWRAVAATAAERRAAIAKKAARILSVEEVEASDTSRRVRHLHCARAHRGPKLDCEMRALTDWFVCRLAPQIEKQGGLPPAEQVVKLSGRIVGDGGFVVWRGRLRRGAERALEGTWVRSNFKASFLHTVLAARGAFVYIPTGHAQDRPPLSASMGGHLVWDGPKVLAATATPVKSVAACPVIAYRQGGVDLCAAYVLASAVYFFGDASAAAAIAACARAALASGDSFGHVRMVVRSQAAGWSEVPLAQHDPLATRIAEPVHLQLVGSDGAGTHAVATVGGFIFDSAEERALPLSRAVLDRCVGVHLNGATFSHVARAVRLVPGKSVCQWLRRESGHAS